MRIHYDIVLHFFQKIARYLVERNSVYLGGAIADKVYNKMERSLLLRKTETNDSKRKWPYVG